MITHINAVRYNYAGINKTYYGGQDDSWQRYTKDLPIKISTTYSQEIVTITVLEPLEPNTRYAIVFLNSPQGMYEDYLLPFVTAPPTESITQNAATTPKGGTTISQLNVSDKVICSGWVSKESGWLKAWRERYCVVRENSITFATNIDTMHHDHIDLNALLLNGELEPKQNIITITTSNGIWRLKVNSNRSASLNAYFVSKLRAADIASIVDTTKVVVPTIVVSKPTTIVVPPPQTVNELKNTPTEIITKPSVDNVTISTAATTQSKIAASKSPGLMVGDVDKNSEQHATTTNKKPAAVEQDSKVFQQEQVKNLNVVVPPENKIKSDVNRAAVNAVTTTEISAPHSIVTPPVISSQLLAMLSASQTQLQLLSQAAPQSISHLTKLGDSGAVTERQHAYIASHPHLQEYYISFTQAITSAVLAAHTISSGMVKDTRKSIDEKCAEFIDFDKTADWLHIAGSASGIPFASIATGVCKYLIQMPHDMQRKQAIKRIINAFPNINSHKHIETLSREMTILMQIEIQEVSLSEYKQKSLWERAKQTVEWLQTYHNKTPIQSYATTQASMLIQKIIQNDKSPLLLAVQHKDIVKLIEWSIDSTYIGEYTVTSLLHSIRSGVLQPGHSISNGDVKQPPLAVPSVPLQVVDLPTVFSPHVVEKCENNTKIQPAIDNSPPLLSPPIVVSAILPPETKNQDSSVAELLAKIAAMELREKEREIEQSIQKSESEKNRKKLAEMERKMKKLDVIHDIFGGADSDQVKVQQNKSVHEKLDDHLKKSSVASAAQDQIIADLQLLKAHTGFQDYQSGSETDSVKVKQDKLDLFK